MVVTRGAARAQAFQEIAREERIIALDGLVCRIANEAVRERSPRRTLSSRFAAGVLTPPPEATGDIAPAGSYIRRYLSHSLTSQ